MKRVTAVLLGMVFVFLVFSVETAFTQDPVEVGPHIYKVVFENERVRVSEILFKVGDKIGMHSHPDHFVYVLNEGQLRLSYPDGTVQEIAGKVGEVIWVNAESHAGENIGTSEFRALVVELKGA